MGLFSTNLWRTKYQRQIKASKQKNKPRENQIGKECLWYLLISAQRGRGTEQKWYNLAPFWPCKYGTGLEVTVVRSLFFIYIPEYPLLICANKIIITFSNLNCYGEEEPVRHVWVSCLFSSKTEAHNFGFWYLSEGRTSISSLAGQLVKILTSSTLSAHFGNYHFEQRQVKLSIQGSYYWEHQQ